MTSREVHVMHPPNLGWLELKLTPTEMDFLWERIGECTDESFKPYLVGNITESKSVSDKDNIFWNNTLLPLCQMYAQNFANLGSLIPIESSHPYHLQSMWVNYQQQGEFNPLHDHGGVYSFVIWMKIPTKHSEQNQNPIAANSLSPHISNFEFVYKDINGKNQEFIYQMSPDLEGTMLFFPSTLQHIVYPFFNCDEQRISISGNVTIDTSVIL